MEAKTKMKVYLVYKEEEIEPYGGSGITELILLTADVGEAYYEAKQLNKQREEWEKSVEIYKVHEFELELRLTEKEIIKKCKK